MELSSEDIMELSSEDIIKDSGPDRELHPDTTPPDYQHSFDKKEVCKRCGASGFTKGNLCTGKKQTVVE